MQCVDLARRVSDSAEKCTFEAGRQDVHYITTSALYNLRSRILAQRTSHRLSSFSGFGTSRYEAFWASQLALKDIESSEADNSLLPKMSQSFRF